MTAAYNPAQHPCPFLYPHDQGRSCFLYIGVQGSDLLFPFLDAVEKLAENHSPEHSCSQPSTSSEVSHGSTAPFIVCASCQVSADVTLTCAKDAGLPLEPAPVPCRSKGCMEGEGSSVSRWWERAGVLSCRSSTLWLEGQPGHAPNSSF